MKLVSRKITSQLSHSKLYDTFNSSVFCFRVKQFSLDTFHVYVSKQWMNGMYFWIPVKGSLSEKNGQIILNLAVPPYFSFYFGLGLTAVGVFSFLLGWVLDCNRWIASIGAVGMGSFMIAKSFWDANEALKKLTKRIHGTVFENDSNSALDI